MGDEKKEIDVEARLAALEADNNRLQAKVARLEGAQLLRCESDPIVKVPIGYVDGCFDIMHSGHFNAIRQAKQFCDKLLVGIHSDDEIQLNKNAPPVMKQAERYAMLHHIKWIHHADNPDDPDDITGDGVIFSVPYSPSLELLVSNDCDKCFHGDDMPVNSEGVGAYDAIRDAGRLQIVNRTEGVSTTDFIGRLISLGMDHHEELPAEMHGRSRGDTVAGLGAGVTLADQGIKLLQSTQRIAEFCGVPRRPTDADKVVYIDGGFDLFNVSHCTTLKAAKKLGSYLIVGLYDDKTVHSLKGKNYPIATLNERVLCVSACRWVDDIIIGAPAKVTEDMMTSLKIDVFAVGSHTRDKYFQEKDSLAADNPFTAESGLYEVPLAQGKLEYVESEYPGLNAKMIAGRVASNYEAYTSRNKVRVQKEADYYEDKVKKANA